MSEESKSSAALDEFLAGIKNDNLESQTSGMLGAIVHVVGGWSKQIADEDERYAALMGLLTGILVNIIALGTTDEDEQDAQLGALFITTIRSMAGYREAMAEAIAEMPTVGRA
jgi:hypothetical protein